MTPIEKWTQEIEKIKQQILAWSMGVNNDAVGATFFQKNKTKLYTSILFGGLGLLFYFLGLITLARVCWIVLGLSVLSWVWGFLKGLFSTKQ